jgi:hypothetical protein
MPKFRALIKHALFELLSEMFVEWLEVRERAWTKQRCSHCKHPIAFPDAQYCAFCGLPFRAAEPALCTVSFAPPIAPVEPLLTPIQPQETDGLNIGAFPASLYFHNKSEHPDWGEHTRALRAIRLKPEKELPTK